MHVRLDGVSGDDSPRAARALRRTLTLGPLVFVMFFNVSGGAYSIESLVAAAGPALAIAMLVAVPIVYSIPEALIVAELASAVPEEGGYYAWVRRAFGERWAFQNGWWTWMYSLVDMAIYPVMFNQYLAYFVPGIPLPARWGVSLAVIWLSAWLNLRGVRRVGTVSVVAGAFVLGSFALLALGAIPHATHSPWSSLGAAPPATTPALAVALSIALWNYVGWDNASTVEGEIVHATRSYPRALARALPLVAAAYLVPVLAALGATDWRDWREGGWPDIARGALEGRAGAVVAILIAAGGMISALALFNALLMAYSRIPYVMARDGLLPPRLAVTDRRGVPRTAIITSAVFYSIFALAPFAQLVVADVALYSAALFLEFAALVRFRVRDPARRGAFRIPVGTWGVIALALAPVTVVLVVVASGVRDGDHAGPALLGAAIAMAAGFPAYRAAVTARSRRASAFDPSAADPHAGARDPVPAPGATST